MHGNWRKQTISPTTGYDTVQRCLFGSHACGDTNANKVRGLALLLFADIKVLRPAVFVHVCRLRDTIYDSLNIFFNLVRMLNLYNVILLYFYTSYRAHSRWMKKMYK